MFTSRRLRLFIFTLAVIVLYGPMTANINAATIRTDAQTTTLTCDVIVVGDSWAYNIHPYLEDALEDVGYTGQIHNLGKRGSTAKQWSAKNNAFLNELLTLIENVGTDCPPTILVFLGGNDLMDVNDGYLAHGIDFFAEFQDDLQIIVDAIEDKAPSADIVLGSYSLFPEQAATTITRVFGQEGTPQFANSILLGLGTVYADFDVHDPNIHFVSLWGALQDENPNTFDITKWADGQYFADFIHPNSTGYSKVAERLVASQPFQ